MPKLIDYPRTPYTGAWELSEIVDETGGKCSIENAAKKMARKVSGSFKAIIGSAVKFGLLTSKRDLLSTTTLFKRIKHAYDKEEEILFHREAFLAPPLFTQLCRKFRNRELPVQMLDVMLMREFQVEEINAQAVAKLFVEGCQMCGIINESNIMADIDTLNNKSPKRALASPAPPINSIHSLAPEIVAEKTTDILQYIDRKTSEENPLSLFGTNYLDHPEVHASNPLHTQDVPNQDAVATLFNLSASTTNPKPHTLASKPATEIEPSFTNNNSEATIEPKVPFGTTATGKTHTDALVYQLSVTGPGINTTLDLIEAADVEIALALLEKIRRRFKTD